LLFIFLFHVCQSTTKDGTVESMRSKPGCPRSH
jgi:hypothetical protein